MLWSGYHMENFRTYKTTYIQKVAIQISHLYPFERDINDILLGTAKNSENPNEMPSTVAFYQGLHCMQRSKHVND